LDIQRDFDDSQRVAFFSLQICSPTGKQSSAGSRSRYGLRVEMQIPHGLS
jgi:hypothetical protein